VRNRQFAVPGSLCGESWRSAAACFGGRPASELTSQRATTSRRASMSSARSSAL
jgi:hypothetical protein